jgi:outer membrane protein
MKRACAAAFALAFVGAASGKDLLGVYQDALQADPTIRQADANRKAARENAPQAIAELLPQISGNYGYSRTKQDQQSAQPYPSVVNPGQAIAVPFDVNGYTNQHGYNLQLRQSIFSWANWETLKKANKQVAQAEADYKAAEEDLIQRVSTAYFNVLTAQDNLDAQQASLEAIARQLDQANKRYEVGLIAITDVKETQAQRDSQAAAVIDAKRQLASQQQALREITYQEYPSLAKPGDNMPLQSPLPADPDRWVEASMDQNLALVSSRLAADIARDQVVVARSGHLPTIDLSASKNNYHQQVDETFAFGGPPERINYPGESSQGQIQLQVTVPIFSGGLVQSQVRQSQYLWIAAKEHMAAVTRQTEHLARDSYSGVISGVSRVAALRQGLDSAETALKATEAGYEVGTRTAVEVLISRQNLVAAQTSYSQARYAYIESIIELRLAAGNLDAQTLEEINHWLAVSQPLPASPVTEPTPGAPLAPGPQNLPPQTSPLPQQLPPPRSR